MQGDFVESVRFGGIAGLKSLCSSERSRKWIWQLNAYDRERRTVVNVEVSFSRERDREFALKIAESVGAVAK